MEHVSNLAFTTLLFLLLALPGYVARSSYHSGHFTRHLLPRSWTDDIVKAILTAFPFHFLGILLFEGLQHYHYLHYSLDFEAPVRVLMGQYTSSSEDHKRTLSATVALFYDNRVYIIAYYFGVLLIAFLLGHGFRRAVWDYELDVKCPAIFRFKSDWLYELLGRGKLYVPHPCLCQRLVGRPGENSVPHNRTLVFLDAVTDQPTSVEGKAQIYSGIVAGFTVDDKGGLSEIVLAKAKRGKFLVRAPGSKLYKFTLEDIPGRNFILRYATVKNLNLTYLPAPSH